SREYRGLLFVSGRTAPPVDDGALGFEVREPDFAERRVLWSLAIERHGHQPVPLPDLDRLADTFPLTPGGVFQAAADAGRAALVARGSPSATGDELYAACRSQGCGGLGALARRIVPLYRWPDIVLPPSEIQQ